MNILNQLSSQMHDRTEASNRKVVIQCIDNPILLEEIANGITSGGSLRTGVVAEERGATALSCDHAKTQRPIAAIGQVKDNELTQVEWV